MVAVNHIPHLVHTQTAFVWRFLALSAGESQIIHVTAWTEREARSRCPSGCVAVFAARIRQGCAMLKTFRVFASAVNPLGHTIGIAQNVKAVNVQTAIAAVRSESSEYGLSQVIISAVYELKEVH